jgi:hypothetical protein
LPCTFELRCIQSYPLNQEEAAEQRRRHARDRSRPRSTGSGSGGACDTLEDDEDDQ